jgi:hypothetical protein
MGDRATETMELQSRRNAEAFARDRSFCVKCLILDEDTISWISNHSDCFESQSRGDEIVEQVWLCPHELNGYDDDVWDKVGQAIGNRREDQDSPTPDWERLLIS